MTTTSTLTISASEVAHLLRVKLGPLRAWADFLADNIREKQSINGLTLMPCAKLHDGRLLRPVYDAVDVKDFIAAVQAASPNASPVKVAAVKLSVDRGRAWFMNKFDRAGNPTLKRQIWASAEMSTVH